MPQNKASRIESQAEIKAYIQNLNYALDHGAAIKFQEFRLVDDKRKLQYTNKYTVASLFPNENPADALQRELKKLSVEEYIQTVKDIRFPQRSEMREFGRVYNSHEDVYIKIRVELMGDFGKHTAFVMSFHFAERPFQDNMFPYKKKRRS